MTAPVVVILAAGQGTRMRSSVQKLLHPLCGRPIIAWPIAAAQAAGAGRVIVVDSPERRLESIVQDGVELAIQEQPLGTADAVRAATDRIGETDTVVVIAGDAPLVTAESLRGLVSSTRARAPRARSRRWCSRIPPATAGWCGLRTARSSGWWRPRRPATPMSWSCRSERSTRACSPSTAERSSAALREVRADNAQGEHYLPDVLPILRAHERTDRRL